MFGDGTALCDDADDGPPGASRFGPFEEILVGPPLSWTQSATLSITSPKSKVLQANPMTRLARDPEKQGARAKPSCDLTSRDQTKNKSPDLSRVITHDTSRDSICFG